MEQQTQDAKSPGKLWTAGWSLVILLVFLLPLFFIPSLSVAPAVSKYALFVLLTSVSFIIWGVYSLRSGKIGAHLSYVLGSFLLLSAGYAVAGFLSPAERVSLLGAGNGGETALLIFFSSLLGYLSAFYFRSKPRVFLGIAAVNVSFGLIALYYILKIITGWQRLSLGVFGDLISGPLGEWRDVGIFALVAFATSLVFIDSKRSSAGFKVLSGAILLLSSVLLIVQGITLGWIIAGASALLYFCYSLSVNMGKEKSSGWKFPYASLIALIVFALLVTFGGYVKPVVSNQLGISYVEVKPSLMTTLEVGADVVTEDSLFGAGPGQFVNAWRLHKPLEINETMFWNVSYDSGSGAIPSSLATAGFLGFAGWILFGISILVLGIRLLFGREGDPDPIVGSTVFGAILLWAVHFLYNPSFIFTALLFVFAGMMVALSEKEGKTRFAEISVDKSRTSFFVNLLAILALIAGSLWAVYITSRQVTSSVLFQRGIIEINTGGDIAGGEESILNALGSHETGAQERALAEYAIAKLNDAIASDPQSVTPEIFQTTTSQALSFAGRARDLDPANFDSWLMLGAIYEYLASFGVEGASEASLLHYGEARMRDPHTPVIDLAEARISLSEGEVENARDNIEEALLKKTNYAAAYVLLSRIEAGEGDREGALRTMIQAAASAPNDPTIFFQLGSMLFDAERFQEAVAVLERAVITNPYYSNAKLLLGLSYYREGRTEDAEMQFADLKILNPESDLVDGLLEAMSAGEDPFEVIGL